MFTEIDIGAFKSIEKLNYPIRELNILVGPNSSGKTSVLQSFALVKQSINALEFNGSLVNIGNFKDAVYGHDENNRIFYCFSLFSKQIVASSIASRLVAPISFFMEIRGDKAKKPYVARSGLSSNFNQEIIVEYIKDRRTVELSDQPQNRSDTISKFEPLVFDNQGLLPKAINGDENSQRKYKIVYDGVVEEFQRFLYYLSARRGYCVRSESVDGRYSKRPIDVGVQGENVIPVLAHIQNDDEYAEAMEKIRFWLNRFGISESVATLVQANGPNYSLKVKNAQTGIQSTIIDVGFGVNQLLPVIVQCFYAPKGSLILIEQPEAHLHPKLQADIADFLIDVINYGNRVIVETHSEHLLLRIQRRIAENKIMPNKVNLDYFEMTKQGTKVTEIKLDENGYFSEPIPEGFFEEGFEEAFARMKALALKGE